MAYRFEYGTARVRELQVLIDGTAKNGLPNVRGLRLGDELLQPTPRFWKSFFSRFRISDTTFRYFSYEEVFQRVAERAESERFHYCVERSSEHGPRLLAVTSPARPMIGYDEVVHLMNRYGGEELVYQEGVLTSMHAPRSGDHVVHIGADQFQNRYVLQAPIDGYGNPKIHLSLLRLVCTNGAIGYSPAFRTEINVGRDPAYSIARALETYDNDSGYAALWQRFESAQQSWASLRETHELYGLLLKLESRRGFTREGVVRQFYEMTGRPHELYGLSNLDALSVKRQRVLPAKCRVYDLLNFASEVATHHATVAARVSLQAFIGRMVSDEYDMEGTAQKVTDFSDFFLAN